MLPRFSLAQLEIISAEVFYDDSTATKVKESATLLQYESQHFRCRVCLHIPESICDSHWSIGLVQACDGMFLENRYGEVGSSFWEFHPIRTARHKMVNDSDGRQYPFYSQSSSKCELRPGLIKESCVTLQFEDHFYPTVAWQLPYCGGAQLTEVLRKQYFWIWLVAIERSAARDSPYHFVNVHEDNIHVLRTMRWSYSLHMCFDATKPVGRRLQMLNDTQKEPPCLLPTNRPIPVSALSPPHCNATQSLLWYPRNRTEKPRILVPPRQIIVPWEIWMRDMVPGRERTVFQKPDDCKLVGEWNRDEEMGVFVQPTLKSQLCRRLASRIHRNQSSPKREEKHFPDSPNSLYQKKMSSRRHTLRSFSSTALRLMTE